MYPRRLISRFPVTILAPALVFGWTSLAWGRATVDSQYTYAQTFASALRMIRVDNGFKILERDQDMGYILFEYTSPESRDRVSPGSIQLAATDELVRVSIDLPAMPSYHEAVLASSLGKKLVAEHGAPPPKAKPKPAPAEPKKPAEGEGGAAPH